MSTLSQIAVEIENEFQEYQNVMEDNLAGDDVKFLMYADIKKRVCKKHKIALLTYTEWECEKAIRTFEM